MKSIGCRLGFHQWRWVCLRSGYSGLHDVDAMCARCRTLLGMSRQIEPEERPMIECRL